MAISTKYNEVVTIEGDSWHDCREQAKGHFDLHDYQQPQPQVEERPKAYAELDKLSLLKLLRDYGRYERDCLEYNGTAPSLLDAKKWMEEKFG